MRRLSDWLKWTMVTDTGITIRLASLWSLFEERLFIKEHY